MKRFLDHIITVLIALLACNQSTFGAEQKCETDISNTLSLCDVIKTESKNVEVFPIDVICERRWKKIRYEYLNVRYELTYKRFQPFYRVVHAAESGSLDEVNECVRRFDEYDSKEKALALFATLVYILRTCRDDCGGVLQFDEPSEEIKPDDLKKLLIVFNECADSLEVPFGEVQGDRETWETEFREVFLRWQYALGRRNPFFTRRFQEPHADPQYAFDFCEFIRTAPIEILYSMALAETDPDMILKTSPYQTTCGVHWLRNLLEVEKEIVDCGSLAKAIEKGTPAVKLLEATNPRALEFACGDDLTWSDEDLLAEARTYRAFLRSQFAELYLFPDKLDAALSVRCPEPVSANFSIHLNTKTLGDYAFEMLSILARIGSPTSQTESRVLFDELDAVQARRRGDDVNDFNKKSVPLDSRTELYRRIVKECVDDICAAR